VFRWRGGTSHGWNAQCPFCSCHLADFSFSAWAPCFNDAQHRRCYCWDGNRHEGSWLCQVGLGRYGQHCHLLGYFPNFIWNSCVWNLLGRPEIHHSWSASSGEQLQRSSVCFLLHISCAAILSLQEHLNEVYFNTGSHLDRGSHLNSPRSRCQVPFRPLAETTAGTLHHCGTFQAIGTI
jgi:hypothetical protein